VADEGTWRRLRNLALALGGAVGVLWMIMVRMPGRSYRGALPPLNDAERALRDRLRADVEQLAGPLAERNLLNTKVLAQAVGWLTSELEDAGYKVTRQTYQVDRDTCSNLIAELRGTVHPDRIFVVGAHYDSVGGSTPGANDNGSGVAATLALARHFAHHPLPITLRFVLFVNEEPPYFWTSHMGSLVYARSLRAHGDQVVGMWSLETMGYFSDAPGSQHYPGIRLANPMRLFYPGQGDFIAFIANAGSGRLVRDVVRTWRRQVKFPSEGMAASSAIPGIGWSDHWSFWKAGYPAMMVTDTALFRYPHYHKSTDTADKLDYERLARVVSGLAVVLPEVAQ